MTRFGSSALQCIQFDLSVPISTYIYSLFAGSFAILHPKESEADAQISMRLLCRKSLVDQVAKLKDDWFRVTIKGIRFYEVMFNTPYPFDKLD